MTESRRLCAFITKVRKGSLADTVGHLRPGTCYVSVFHILPFSSLGLVHFSQRLWKETTLMLLICCKINLSSSSYYYQCG